MVVWDPVQIVVGVDGSEQSIRAARVAAGLAHLKGCKLHIVTVVRPHLAENVLNSLRRAPIEALSVMEVKGYGRQKSYLDEYQETEYSQAFVPKVEITLWVDDSRCEEILEKIVGVARSGRIGDGKIFVTPLDECIRIRTGEKGPEAI